MRQRYAKLTLALSLVAAALALSAALITYLTVGEVKLSLIAAGILLLASGFWLLASAPGAETCPNNICESSRLEPDFHYSLTEELRQH